MVRETIARVQRPPLFQALRDRHRCSGAYRTLAATPPTDCQNFFAVDPLLFLLVHKPAFALEQNFEAALFHAAIATQIYEAMGDEEAAAPMRNRRANLACKLPVKTVAELGPRIID